MIYKYLANTGIKVPSIAQGTTGLGSRQNFDPDRLKARISVMKCGIEAGLTFIDTAELYGGGFSEEITGGVIAGVRDKIFLASKFNPDDFGGDSVFTSLENSLRRLKTDYLDLYQVHWPNPSIPIDNIMRALDKLIQSGKIRFAGLSNFSLNGFKAAESHLNGKIVSNQREYNLLDRSVETDFLPYAIINNVTLLAYSPLNQGRLFSDLKQGVVLAGLARKYEKSIAQVVLRWLIDHEPVIAVIKTGSIDHMKEIAASTDFNLEAQDFASIDNLCRTELAQVPTDRIRLCGISDRPVYATVAEALENKLDLIPSPANLAKLFERGDFVRPIRLQPTKDTSGRFLYDIDTYDIWDHVKKYWAWIMAFGNELPIPAFILGGKDEEIGHDGSL